MTTFILSCGIFFWPIMLAALVMAGVTVSLLLRRDRQAGDLGAVPFWGVVALVLGVLGQCSGIYNALQVIRQAKEISPAMVAAGFAESFTSTLLGLVILLISLLAYAALKRFGPGVESARG